MLDLLPAVRERGWKAMVAAPGSGPLFDRARAAGADTAVIRLGPYSDGKKTPGDVVRFSLDTLRLSRWIARQDADLLYLSSPRPLVAAALGARRRPVVFHAQHFMGKRYAVAAVGWAVGRARTTVIANSSYVGAQFQNHVPPGRMYIVYNGIAGGAVALRNRRPQAQWRIGLIGRIAPMKGHADFLRAARLVAPQLAGARFIICGAPMFCPAAYEAEVRRLAEGLPVDFLGWREDVGAVLEDLDLLVVPSNPAEATTRVILEAFEARVPVLAYAAGAIPEVVRDGDNGYLVQECEPGALARRILELASIDLLPAACRARADWERNYTLERYRHQMLSIIESCATTT